MSRGGGGGRGSTGSKESKGGDHTKGLGMSDQGGGGRESCKDSQPITIKGRGGGDYVNAARKNLHFYSQQL